MERFDRRISVRKSGHDIGSAHHQSGKSGIYRVQQTVQVPGDNDPGEKGKRYNVSSTFHNTNVFFCRTTTAITIVSGGQILTAI